MLKKLSIILLSLLILCQLMAVNAMAQAWKAEITATGQVDPNATAVNKAVVEIGIDPNAATFPPPPDPPAYTVLMTLAGPYYGDIRAPGGAREVWTVNVSIPGSFASACKANASRPGFFPVLSWDPNKIGPRSRMELWLNSETTGTLKVSDMKATTSYQTDANDSTQYLPSFNLGAWKYVVVYEPAPTWYLDADGDLYGDANYAVMAETQPTGYAGLSGDCDESDPNRNPGKTEICDGKDNDCDGSIDEGITPIPTTCGLGVCASTGQMNCVGGTLQDTCVAGSPTGTDDNCNGLDEDCSGTADEDYVPTATSCGVGVCARTGQMICSASGTLQNTCVAGSPTGTDDNCNGLDENCNGTLNENYVPTATSCGVGVCARTGQMNCVGGALQDTCVAGAPTGSDNDCNGLDENCNGTPDENYAVTPTSCGVGVCASTGQMICQNGTVKNTCTPGTPTGSDNNCNNIDENCSGTSDENYVATATSCGVGACVSTGQLICVAGSTQDTCTPGTPSAEICDGIDNDCDADAGELANEADADNDGYRICAGDCKDNNAAINPGKPEIYDGVDNNCKDGVDEICYFTQTLTAKGQFYITAQTASVDFGLDEMEFKYPDPNNWSLDRIVRLELIDSNAVVNPPITDADYLTSDIRGATGQLELAWSVMVEIDGMADPNEPGYYPLLTWDPNDFGCTKVNSKDYEYKLLRGLGNTGTVLVSNMIAANAYQSTSQDGDPVQYFTILWKEKPAPPAKPAAKPAQQMPWGLPWPGVSFHSPAWPNFPASLSYPIGLLFQGTTRYAAGISIPSFPGTFPGLFYPGGIPIPTYLYSTPWLHPTAGAYPAVGFGWPSQFWTGLTFRFSNGYIYPTIKK